jgi:NitT/TauT family transport system permease protein
MDDGPPNVLGRLAQRRALGGRLGRPRRNRRLLVSVTAFAVWLLLWEVASKAGVLDGRFFSPPSRIAVALRELAASGELVAAVTTSLTRLGIGFVIGAVPGLILGVAMAVEPTVRWVLRPFVGAMHPIPKTAILPLILLIVGIGESAQYLIVASGVFFVVVESSFSGVSAVPQVYFDVGKSLGRSRLHRSVAIALPAAAPSIRAGVQIALAVGLSLLVVGEMLIAQSGLGNIIWQSWQTFQIPRMFAALVCIAIVGLATQVLVDVAGRRLMPWLPRQDI